MTTTHAQSAQRLLAIHSGACSVPKAHPLAAHFRFMQLRGEVIVQDSGTTGFLNVYSADFKPRYAGKGEL
jgi:hypothetical protein